MKNNSLLATVGLGLALIFGFGSQMARAQVTETLKVKLPQEAVVGNTTLQPGEYLVQVERPNDNAAVLEFSSLTGGPTVFAIAEEISTPNNAPSAGAQITLRRVGGRYEADKVFFEGLDYGFELLPVAPNK